MDTQGLTMKKRYYLPVIILIVLMGLALTIPYSVGFVVQKRFAETLKVLSQSGSLQFNLESYHRGWFSSNATIRVKTKHPAMLNQWLGSQSGTPVEFLVTQKIQHGPILKVVSPKGVTRWIMGQALITIRANPVVGSVHSITLVNLDGSLLSAITAPAIHFSNPDVNSDVKMMGFAATVQISRDFRKIILRVNTPKLVLITKDFQQEVANFSAEYDLKRSANGLYLGTKNTQISDASWQTPDQQLKIQLQGLSILSKSEEINAHVNYEVNTVLQNIIIDNVQYGQQQFNLAINKIDVASLLALSRELKNTQQAANVGWEQLLRYNQLATYLLSKGVEINLKNLSLDTKWGQPTLAMHIVLRPEARQVNSPVDLINDLTAKADLYLPAAFLTQALTVFNQALAMSSPTLPDIFHFIMTTNTDPNLQKLAQQKIAFWLENKWIVAEGDAYRVNFVFQDGQAIVNGQPFVNKPMPLPLSPAPVSSQVMGIPETEVTPGAANENLQEVPVIRTAPSTRAVPGIGGAPLPKPKIIIQPSR